MLDEKAQLHTLEGVTAVTIILLVLIYIIDATSLTPLTSSTANVHVETELQLLGENILSVLDYAEPGYNSKLKNDIQSWNGREYVWNGTKYMDKLNYSYPQNNLTNNLTSVLNITLARQGIAHNVELSYLIIVDNTTVPTSSLLINDGTPSNNAVIVSRKLVLHDGDVVDQNNTVIEDIDASTSLYNVVDIKLVLWRM